ncbi:MAG TPA: DUF3634 family protein [Polyangiaceae bacterium]|nr:DUF3634 family protein [Polyangiaceae bacterium]
MDSLTPVAALLVVVTLFLWYVARKNEFFRVSIRKGRVLVVRGRIPTGYLDALRDIARGVEHGTVRAVKDAGQAQLLVSPSIDAVTAQRMRNTFSLYPTVKLRAAPRIARPNLGQVLGLAWLAWRLERK